MPSQNLLHEAHSDEKIEAAFSVLRTLLASPDRYNVSVRLMHEIHIMQANDAGPRDTIAIGSGETLLDAIRHAIRELDTTDTQTLTVEHFRVGIITCGDHTAYIFLGND